MYKETWRAPRTASLPLSIQTVSCPRTQKQPHFLSAEGLEAHVIHAALQRTICAPLSPSYFESLLSSVYWIFLNVSAYRLVVFRTLCFQFQFFFSLMYRSLSFPHAHTRPWLYKAIYLASAVCAMGLFGGEKPDTVLSIAIATAAIRYSSRVPEQVEIKSW